LALIKDTHYRRPEGTPIAGGKNDNLVDQNCFKKLSDLHFLPQLTFLKKRSELELATVEYQERK
jgi:hypothetical protein